MLGIERGGFEEAVIRISRGTVRRDRLERSAHVLAKEEPFSSLGAEKRAAQIREQAIVVEPERAIAALPKLLPDRPARERAIERVEYIVGALNEMEPKTIEALRKIRATLGLLDLGADHFGEALGARLICHRQNNGEFPRRRIEQRSPRRAERTQR